MKFNVKILRDKRNHLLLYILLITFYLSSPLIAQNKTVKIKKKKDQVLLCVKTQSGKSIPLLFDSINNYFFNCEKLEQNEKFQIYITNRLNSQVFTYHAENNNFILFSQNNDEEKNIYTTNMTQPVLTRNEDETNNLENFNVLPSPSINQGEKTNNYFYLSGNKKNDFLYFILTDAEPLSLKEFKANFFNSQVAINQVFNGMFEKIVPINKRIYPNFTKCNQYLTCNITTPNSFYIPIILKIN